MPEGSPERVNPPPVGATDVSGESIHQNRHPLMPHCKVGPAESRACRWILLAWPAGVSAAYPSSMVNPSLQSAIEAMSLDERLELVEYIESTVDQSVIEVTEEQKATIRSRAAELQADPSVGLTWDELDARIGSHWT